LVVGARGAGAPAAPGAEAEEEEEEESSLELTPLDTYLQEEEENSYMAEEEDEEEQQQDDEDQEARGREYRVDRSLGMKKNFSPNENGREKREKMKLSPRSLTRQSRKDNLERSPQAAAFAAGLHSAALVGAEENLDTESKEEDNNLFSREETQQFSKSYNEAILAAGNASQVSAQIEEDLRRSRRPAYSPSSKRDTHSPVSRVSPSSSSSSSPRIGRGSGTSSSSSTGERQTQHERNFSYDEALIGLFQRAKRSGVDWSQMFAVTDREESGTVRERDFQEAMVSFCFSYFSFFSFEQNF
jgi:hypothetical protein